MTLNRGCAGTIITLILQGPGYARYVAQQVLTESLVEDSMKTLSFGGMFMLDDQLTSTSRVKVMQKLGKLVARRRLTSFRDRLMRLQREPLFWNTSVALAGMLHDSGPLATAKRPFVFDSRSIYKLAFLNLRVLRNLRVHYQQNLRVWEDVCFVDEILHAGGHTFKCQRSCFRAVKSRRGGADVARSRITRSTSGITLADLVGDQTSAQPDSISRLLSWARGHER